MVDDELGEEIVNSLRHGRRSDMLLHSAHVRAAYTTGRRCREALLLGVIWVVEREPLGCGRGSDHDDSLFDCNAVLMDKDANRRLPARSLIIDGQPTSNAPTSISAKWQRSSKSIRNVSPWQAVGQY
jgi:hypothetical protein